MRTGLKSFQGGWGPGVYDVIQREKPFRSRRACGNAQEMGHDPAALTPSPSTNLIHEFRER